ncbi:MAG: isoprenylcysteine carboxylmethyltransferase family protein [Acidobacteria bacterium]|nr:isoprenylcysteine carboxylmethyltransferase family protein [Acidobacteriota bacterium]MBV9476289.1 isoprenylcysteine carboxylmethyltransferase family protein [Acidobacteriota bacterium]
MTFQWIFMLWGVSEIVLAIAKRSGSTGATRKDRGSLSLLWLAIGGGIALAVWLAYAQLSPIALPRRTILAVAVSLLLAGVVLRVAAIATLKKSFTVDVAVRADQTIIQHGPYRWMRHPAYTGALLSFYGFALSFGDWLSVAAVVVPVTLAFAYRIRVEERALVEQFGREYEDYMRRTKRLVPGVF